MTLSHNCDTLSDSRCLNISKLIMGTIMCYQFKGNFFMMSIVTIIEQSFVVIMMMSITGICNVCLF